MLYWNEKGFQNSAPDYVRGIFYGDGIFDTLAVRDGAPAFQELHLSRLYRSAKFLRIQMPDISELKDIVASGLQQQPDTTSVRITAVRDCDEGMSLPATTGKLLLSFRPHATSPTPLKLQVSELRVHSSNVLLQHKVCNYLGRFFARDCAIADGYEDALFLNESGNITECSTANIFFLRRNLLLTPPVTAGLLPGIIRSQILEHAAAAGFVPLEKSVPLASIASFEAAFITSASRVAVQVLQIGDNHFGALPGEMEELRQRIINAG